MRSGEKKESLITILGVRKCDYCSKKATVFFTGIKGGKKISQCFCMKCAVEKGFIDASAIDVAEQIFNTKINPSQPNEFPKKEPSENMKEVKPPSTCPQCGYTLSQFEETGRLGCPHCYVVFHSSIFPSEAREGEGKPPEFKDLEDMMRAFSPSDELFSILEDIQGTVEPDASQSARENQKKPTIEDLQKELQTAVEAENYEQAAMIRDQINALNSPKE